jgi:hypothetical protein
MGAVEYFQKNGLKASKELVEMGFGFCSAEGGLSFHTEQLKQLVESHELVMDYCGLTRAKEHAESNYTAPEIKDALKQAIADVESCLEADKKLEGL